MTQQLGHHLAIDLDVTFLHVNELRRAADILVVTTSQLQLRGLRSLLCGLAAAPFLLCLIVAAPLFPRRRVALFFPRLIVAAPFFLRLIVAAPFFPRRRVAAPFFLRLIVAAANSVAGRRRCAGRGRTAAASFRPGCGRCTRSGCPRTVDSGAGRSTCRGCPGPLAANFGTGRSR